MTAKNRSLLTWLWRVHRLHLLLDFDLRKGGAKCCCATGCRLSRGGHSIGHRSRNRRCYSHGCREGRENCRRLRGRWRNWWGQKSRNGLWQVLGWSWERLLFSPMSGQGLHSGHHRGRHGDMNVRFRLHSNHIKKRTVLKVNFLLYSLYGQSRALTASHKWKGRQ